jgi:hypothetical protein
MGKWKRGREEKGKIGKLEDWKIGKLEDWKDGKMVTKDYLLLFPQIWGFL